MSGRESTSSMPADTEKMIIEHSCTRLQHLYCYYADHRMVDKFVELFTSDASLEIPGANFAGHTAIRESIAALGALPLEYRHITTNSIINTIDENRANGTCYLVVFNSDAKPNQSNTRPSDIPSTVGEYHDSFQRTRAGWRIASRQLIRVFRNPADPLLNPEGGPQDR